MARYKLLKKYECPTGHIDAGVIKSVEEWGNLFRITPREIDFKEDWFELVKPNHEERYAMCHDQKAQIDCRKDDCPHYDRGNCLNISPAITLNANKTFVCWTYNQDERN